MNDEPDTSIPFMKKQPYEGRTTHSINSEPIGLKGPGNELNNKINNDKKFQEAYFAYPK